MSNKVISGTANAPYFSQQDIIGMYHLRGKVFKERLNWDVQTQNGLEIDEFDQLNPIYLLSKNYRNDVEGCLRLIPTSGPYMLEKVFPQLLRGETIPKNKDIWEMSRCAVELSSSHPTVQGNMNDVTVGIIRNAYEFAVLHDIEQYVAVVSVAFERLLKQLGLPMRRFGDGRAVRLGKVLSTAVWIDVNDEYRLAVRDQGFAIAA
ncbi:MAG: autoinducer synthesis protein [Gammaproteobacteria bacterium]|nr:MAG: autoinducer synthesis protein [Gammaproteobacteria bacterium]